MKAKLLLTLALSLALAGMANAQLTPNTGAFDGAGRNVVGGLNVVGSVKYASVGTPSAPLVTVQGTAGSTTVNYYCVGFDINGNSTPISAAGTTTTSNATRSATNDNYVQCPGQAGATKYQVWSGGTSGTHVLGTCQSQSSSTSLGSGCFVIDTGQALTAGTTPPTSDQTGTGTIYTLTQSTSMCSTSGVLANTCVEPTVTLPAVFSTKGTYSCTATCTQTVTGVPVVEDITEAAASPKIQVVIAAMTAVTASCTEVSIQCTLPNALGS